MNWSNGFSVRCIKDSPTLIQNGVEKEPFTKELKPRNLKNVHLPAMRYFTKEELEQEISAYPRPTDEELERMKGFSDPIEEAFIEERLFMRRELRRLSGLPMTREQIDNMKQLWASERIALADQLSPPLDKQRNSLHLVGNLQMRTIQEIATERLTSLGEKTYPKVPVIPQLMELVLDRATPEELDDLHLNPYNLELINQWIRVLSTSKEKRIMTVLRLTDPDYNLEIAEQLEKATTIPQIRSVLIEQLLVVAIMETEEPDPQ